MTAPSGPGRLLAPSRLLALRLQGFKSFAERTIVEFGGGISAIVGPNGSGKSNLADALRWALGEQGRALRSRKAEDVIWAGSDKRAAQGMADVTLVIDNADGLLPVDFQVLELGRRLYRSGENDYLLNKQRIRLRDLVELLDAAHLADNAFLFIGQGMVDQALALRPEERRPLFEEVAGVRRHERRRRRAQEQLIESEANLARVEDIVAELRPQARRLAAQAEQQTSRQTTADELAAAILLSAHARWHESAARVGETQARRAAAGADADRAMADMTAAEAAASGVAAELGARAIAERERARRPRRRAGDADRRPARRGAGRLGDRAPSSATAPGSPRTARPPRRSWPPDAGRAPCPCRRATSTSRRPWPRPSARRPPRSRSSGRCAPSARPRARSSPRSVEPPPPGRPSSRPRGAAPTRPPDRRPGKGSGRPRPPPAATPPRPWPPPRTTGGRRRSRPSEPRPPRWRSPGPRSSRPRRNGPRPRHAPSRPRRTSRRSRAAPARWRRGWPRRRAAGSRRPHGGTAGVASTRSWSSIRACGPRSRRRSARRPGRTWSRAAPSRTSRASAAR